MTAPLPIEEVVDRCIEEIRRGRASVEECLLRYPEHRRALEPLLRAGAAMSALPRGEQATAPDPQQRLAFMAALRETPQQRGHRRLPSLGPLFGAGAFRVVGPAFALAALAIVLVLGGGGTPATASTLTVFDGEVQRLDGVEWQPMRDGDELGAGVRMRTGATGYALITFPDGSTVTLDPLTELTIETLAVAPRRVEVRQQSGRLWHDIVHDETEGARFVVLTPDARVEVLGTVFETTVNASTGQTDVATVDGEVRVVAGTSAVPVGRGETLRTRKSTIEAVSTAPLLDSALTVSGPFAAAIMAADGRGAGGRVDGVVFRQLRGVTTSREDGVQRFDLQDIDTGEFTLVLQRYGDGDGQIVLDAPGGQQRFTLDAGTRTARLPLRLGIVEGLPSLIATALQSTGDATASTARVAKSDLTKSAVDLAAQGKDATAAAARAVATKTPTPKPTAKTVEQKPPTPSATERVTDRTATPVRTPSVTPTRAISPASATPALTSPTSDAAVVAYTQRLRAAIASGKLDTIRAALSEALAGDNATLKRGRVAVIAAALENETNAQRIGTLFVSGENGALRDSLRAALSENGGEGRARFDAAIVGADARRLKQTSEQRTPTPTVIPTRTATATPTATATATSSAIIRPTATPSITPPTR